MHFGIFVLLSAIEAVNCVFSEVSNKNETNFRWNLNSSEIDFAANRNFGNNYIYSQTADYDNTTSNGSIPLSHNLDFAYKGHSEHTELLFSSFSFNYSKIVDRCITDYNFLRGFLRKIALTFYYSSKVMKLENEEFKRNSNMAWKIARDHRKRINISINITKYNGEIDDNLNFETLPGPFLNNLLHSSNTSWVGNEFSRFQRENSTYRLVDVLKNEDSGIFSIRECICNFVLETQRNLDLNVTSIEKCEKKIDDIILAMKANPEAEFDLTQVSLDQPPSKLVVPDNVRGVKISRKWRESVVEGKELVFGYNFTSGGISLVNKTSEGINVVRELLSEYQKSEINSDQLKANDKSNKLNYFDSRDVNGKSCVYFPYDQGKCGGCYAFVVSSSVSISNCIQESILTAPLSPQQIIDCSQGFGNLGCNGGFYSNGWSYLLESNNPQNSFCSWEEYPYVESKKICRANKCTGCLTVGKYNVFTGLSLTGDDGWDFVTTVLPKVGSISLSVNSNLPGFTSYSGGIYKAPKCTVPSDLDHAVIMVGFGVSSNGEKYYVIQNSWGVSWGISGFMNISTSSCDMLWYPGIIRQLPSGPISEVCEENVFLLAGPGRTYNSNSLEIKRNIVHLNIFMSIIVFCLVLVV
ncbi:cathepsin like thiol protease membrane associated [Cryptosporidium xiaoi]|uniref:Cathepsin like thiol protease membrane associated n=1 Tax=Cryptosporidium xiaoi TaxID=659607 RepID=A0AAV9Y3C7_9CRYT